MPTDNKHESRLRAARQRAFDYVSEQMERIDACPVCHGNDWAIPDSTYVLREVTADGYTENVFPLVLATCRSCGYVLLFNASMAGTVDDWHFDKDARDAVD
ncbi:hypothetical protein [Bifidobacterium stellenboschense]|uniref:Uncharacterized protein n=1 Tax=Bifidobacterium stellenboschense TaxID=762211 RepID=A0A087DQM8_9BIFI|nr:hypothetical protein [Bifidobacterium stellenboschense]KFI97828.1 hypothetical protein BSTEL_0639 [Bifidobacterium stellenboschense]